MKPQAFRLIIWGQACLYIGLIAAVLLKPAGLSSNNGISYFGIYAHTIIPYVFGLLGSAYLCWLASRAINESAFRPLRQSLVVISLLTAVIVMTPYSVKPLLDWFHTAAGSALFGLQLLLSGWLTYKLRYPIMAVILTVIELAAGIACAIYLLPKNGLLMQSQILFQLAFGALLIYSLRRFSNNVS